MLLHISRASFEQDGNKHWFLSLGIACFCMSTLSMLLRLYTRVFVQKKYGWEDYSICLAYTFQITKIGLAAAGIRFGFFWPISQVPPQNLILLTKLGIANDMLYNPTIAFAKMCILLQILRIFVPRHQIKTYYFMVGFIIVNMLWNVSACLTILLQCTPLKRLWDHNIPGHCINYTPWVIVWGIFYTASDIIVLGLPFVWIWRLKLNMRKKITAFAVFAFGIVACGASVVRFVYALAYAQSTGTILGQPWLLVVGACGSAEETATIVCANLTCLPAFLRHISGRGRPSGVITHIEESISLSRRRDRSLLSISDSEALELSDFPVPETGEVKTIKLTANLGVTALPDLPFLTTANGQNSKGSENDRTKP